MDLASLAAMAQAKFWWFPFVVSFVYVAAWWGTHLFKSGSTGYGICFSICNGAKKVLPPGWGAPVVANGGVSVQAKVTPTDAPSAKGYATMKTMFVITFLLVTAIGCATMSNAQAKAQGVQVAATVTLPDGTFFAVTGTAETACVSSPKWFRIPNTPFECDEGGCLTIAPSGSNATVQCRLVAYPQDTFPIMVALPNLPKPATTGN